MKGWTKAATVAAVVLVGIGVLIGYFRWYTKAVITAAVAPSTASVASVIDEETSQRLLQVVTEARNRLGVPSLQVALVASETEWWTASIGLADPKAGRAATITDRYHVGSVSKPYTAAVILKLAESGALSLEDPVSKFVPDIPNGDRITIRQLLNHTSGLANYTEKLSFQLQTVFLHKKWTLNDIVAIIREQAPRNEPGGAHYYSNSNYVLLGMVAEAAGRDSFTALLGQHVLQPLGLTDTYFAPQAASPTGTVRGYDVSILGTGNLGITKAMEGLRAPFEGSAFTAGGITASALDVARFTAGLFDGSLLQPPSISALLTLVAAPDEDVPGQSGYGLGVRQLEIGGDSLVGHTGIFPGFANVSMYSRQHGYTITVLSNLSSPPVNEVLAEIQRVWNGRP